MKIKESLPNLRNEINLIDIKVHMSDGIRRLTIKKKYIPGFCHNEDCQSGHLFGQVMNEIANLQRQDT